MIDSTESEVSIQPLASPAPDIEAIKLTIPPLKGEPANAYKALLDFCITSYTLQQLRSTYAKMQAVGKIVPSTERKEINNWHDKFQWATRRLNYDLERAAQVEQDFVRLGEENRRKMSESKTKMLGRISQMLEYPIERQVVTERLLVTADMIGKEIDLMTVVEPANWNLNTTATMLNSVVAADKNDRSEVRFMIAELKKLGYKVTANDGTVVTTAIDLLEAQE